MVTARSRASRGRHRRGRTPAWHDPGLRAVVTTRQTTSVCRPFRAGGTGRAGPRAAPVLKSGLALGCRLSPALGLCLILEYARSASIAGCHHATDVEIAGRLKRARPRAPRRCPTRRLNTHASPPRATETAQLKGVTRDPLRPCAPANLSQVKHLALQQGIAVAFTTRNKR